MIDHDVVAELAQQLNLGDIAKAERGPARTYGFAPMVILEPVVGPRIVVKEGNVHSGPIDPNQSQAAILHRRLQRLGAPVPVPVLRTNGLNPSVREVEGDVKRPGWRQFAAATYVEGSPLLQVAIDEMAVKRCLQTVGKIGGMLKHASYGASWSFSSNLSESVRGLIKAARERGVDWADDFAAVAPKFVAISERMAFNKPGEAIVPADLAPKDFLLTPSGDSVWVDVERFSVRSWDGPLPERVERNWLEWAECAVAIGPEAAHGLIQSAFEAEIGRRPARRQVIEVDDKTRDAMQTLYKRVRTGLSLTPTEAVTLRMNQVVAPVLAAVADAFEDIAVDLSAENALRL